MRVAIVGSLLRAVASDSTGGTEVFTSLLTEGLIKKGIDVTLFATSDSKTSAKLESVCSSEQTTGVYEGSIETRIPYEVMQANNVILQSDKFDLIHNNAFHFYMIPIFSSLIKTSIITTIHNNYWHFPNLKSILEKTHKRNKDLVVFLSNNAKEIAGGAVDAEVINNGIDVQSFPFSADSKEYILWFGRLVASKGMKDAMDAAAQGGFPLTVAGTPSSRPEDIKYFAENITPSFTSTIKYVGPPELDKISLYQGAKALIFPMKVEEQFPLVILEAMACGTPVIAYNRGAASDEIVDGVTGFIIDPDDSDRPGKGSWIIKKQGIDGLVEAVKRVGEIDRASCRSHVEKKFTVDRMVSDYINLYEKMLK